MAPAEPGTPLRIGLVGLGKIARDQHIPSIATEPGVTLAAVASRTATWPGVPCFPTLEALLRDGPPVDAIALCTPPQGRAALAAAALAAGKHVLLEKPPGATVAELAPLVATAQRAGLALFATWHARFAAAVEPARAFLARHPIRAMRVDWKEDVRVWHPGQDWIWQPGGLGVFDPGINALSILTRILPEPAFLTRSELTFPANRAAPIAARLGLATASGLQLDATFDWRQTGPQRWDITAETGAGTMTLSGGGRTLTLDGQTLTDGPDQEYAAIYRRFAHLAAQGRSDVDLTPLTLVADAFLLATRVEAAPFA